MWIIDRYVLRQYLQNFVICFVSLAGVYVVFDAFTNLESFLRAAEKHGGLFRAMGVYYAFRALWFFDRTAGLLTLAAAMFTAAWIQRHNELIALMAAGVSRVRVMRRCSWRRSSSCCWPPQTVNWWCPGFAARWPANRRT